MARSTIPPPMLGHAPGTTLHRQLFSVLRDEITRGVYARTGALPKEESLGERFGVSRITVRRALADLATLGLVERRHGLGTFVRAEAAAPPRAHPSLSVIESLRETATTTDVTVLEVERSVPPPEIAVLLLLPPEQAAVHAVRLRSIRGTPVMLTQAWVPADVGKKVTATGLRKHALYELLQAQGVGFGRVVQELSSQLADPDSARHLRTEVGSALTRLVRLMHDRQDRPILHLTALLPPAHSRILMDIPADQVNTLSAGQFVYDVAG